MAGQSVAILIGIALYLLPAVIALLRRHTKFPPIAALNVLLGWTVLGWLVALFWASAGGKKPVFGFEADGKITAVGAGGTMTFDGQEVTITRKGGLSFVIHGLAGEKTIPASAIQSVQIRPARGGVRGYVQLAVMGGIENRGGAVGAAGDENSVLFDTHQQPAFERLAEAIKASMRSRNGAVQNRHSDADEIAKLADLRARGVLTDEEFARKKAELLR